VLHSTRQIRKKEKELLLGEVERAQKRESAISKLRQNLADNPELIVTGEDESVLYPQEELDNVHYPEEQLQRIKCTAIQRMDIALNSHEGENIITSCINGRSDYVLSVLKIMELLKTKDVRISRIIERIRYEIHEHGFNVFISCKSQDYELAYELYDYLAANGFKPFLADASLKDVGIDQYTAVIGEVINVCQNMVVFATDVAYLQTPYVMAEWHMFVNDINTGHKPDAKIVNVLSPDIDVHSLPSWLRDKQCLTITDYKNNLLYFLENHDNNAFIQGLNGKIRDKRSQLFQIIDKLHFECRDEKIVKQIHALYSKIDRDTNRLMRLLQELIRYTPQERRLLSCKVEYTLDYLENETQKLVSLCQHNQEQEEVLRCSISDKTRGVSCASQPRGNSPFKMMRKSSDNMLEESFLPLIPQNDTFAIDKKVNYKQGFFNCLKRIFGRNRNGSFFSDFSKAEELEGVKVKSSVFAPYEVASGQHMLVQVYLHLPEETGAVISLASEADMNAVRRGYESLDIKLKEEDEVGIELNVCSDTLLLNSRKSVIWHGSYVKRAFDFMVPSNLTADELSSTVNIYVNGAYAGEMIFLTKIVSSPRSLYTNVLSKMPKKLFISYSHKDVQTAERIAKIHEALGIDVFFDKHRLKAGYIFSEEIFEFIHSSDTFLLCWSENAKGSDYVQKERHEAMSLAYPWFKPRDKAPLKILTYTIEPHTTPPDDMKKYYFENL